MCVRSCVICTSINSSVVVSMVDFVFFRLPILVCQGICRMKRITNQPINEFQSNGQHLKYCDYTIVNFTFRFLCYRLSTTTSTLHRVMCGVLVLYYMRYGVSDTNHFNITQIKR